MQFLLVMAVIAAVSIAEYAPHEPVGQVGLRLMLATFGMSVAPLFAVATSTFIAGSIRRDHGRKLQMMRRFNTLRSVHSAVWLLLAGVILHQLGWVQLVRFNGRLDGMFLVDDLLILLPIVLPLCLSWTAFYEVERVLQTMSGDCRAATFVTRSQYLALHVRHYLALMLVPVLAVMAVQDVVKYLGPAISEEAAVGLLFIPIIGIALLFPLLLQFIWRTEPLPDGELRERLLTFSSRQNFVPGKLLLWNTNRMIVNAAVAGFVRPMRYVFFTDSLLARFSDDEIEAVLAHEIGHVRRRHLPQRVLVMALPVVLWFALSRAMPTTIERASEWLVAAGMSTVAQTAILGPLLLALYGAIMLAAHSKLLEYDADLYGCRACDPSGSLTASGIDRLAVVLEKLAIISGAGKKTRSWLHPTLGQRLAFLDAVAEDPSMGVRFERRLRFLTGSMLIAMLAAGAYLLLESAQSLN